MTSSPSNSIGPFLQTSTYFPEDFEKFRIKFLEIYRNIADTVNVKESGVFDLQEVLTAEQWFAAGNPQATRQTFRKVFNLGAVAAGATLTTAHNISGAVAYTHIYGTAVTAADFRPLPYASTVAIGEQVSLTITGTNIVIVNGATAANITSAIVVVEYLKN